MRRHFSLTLIASALALNLHLTPGNDSFLDRPIAQPEKIKGTLLVDEIKSIDPTIGKRVIFPPDFVDFVTQERLEQGGMTISPPKKGNFTIRDYLDEKGRSIANLRWKYDLTQDAIIFDFAWHCTPSRPASELVKQLQASSPQSLRLAVAQSSRTDPWQVCLNELMSEPDNFPHTWKVRLEDGRGTMHDYAANYDVFGFCDASAHLLNDAAGKSHLLVLNYHMPYVTPGPSPAFTYYLFTADGKWEDGGTFEAGSVYSAPKIIFEPDKNRVTIEMIDKPIVLTSMDDKNTQTIINPDRVRAVYHDYLTVKDGRLTSVFLKDEKPLSKDDDGAVRVSPLRH